MASKLPPEIAALVKDADPAFVKRPFPYSTRDAEAMIRALKKGSDAIDEEAIYGDKPRELGGYVKLGEYSSESDVVFVVTGEERGQVWMVGNENFPAVGGRGKTLRRATYAEWVADQAKPAPAAEAEPPPSELDLRNEAISGDDAIARAATIPKLELLRLPAHAITSFAPLASHKKLRVLSIGYWADGFPALKSLPADIAKLRKLTSIDINCQHLAKIPVELTKLTELRNIVVRSDALKDIPEGLESLPKLKWLDVNDCPLTPKTRQRLAAYKGKAHIVGR